VQVLDHGVQVEAFKFPGVVEGLAHRIREAGMLVENPKIELVRPPVTVRVRASSARDRALGFIGHVFSDRVRRFSLSYIEIIQP
jgi:hypothetical protein